MKLFFILSISFLTCKNFTSDQDTYSKEPISDFKILLENIRTYKISPDSAQRAYQKIIFSLKNKYSITDSDTAFVSQITFPLRTKNYKSVGGKGKGFYPKNYSLFDMSVSGSHPAHDIFVYDIDRDCREEGTLEYIDCVATLKSLVLATESNWKESSGYKGGNYVWLYDLETGSLWYYAHLRNVIVSPGQIVEPGEILGQVGRTGFNADNNRSDTHLHLMLLKNSQDNLPTPYNFFDLLLNARTEKNKKYAKS